MKRAALGAKAASVRCGRRAGRIGGVGGVGGVGDEGREREGELHAGAAVTLELAAEVQGDAALPPVQRARHELAHPQRGRRSGGRRLQQRSRRRLAGDVGESKDTQRSEHSKHSKQSNH